MSQIPKATNVQIIINIIKYSATLNLLAYTTKEHINIY